MRLDEVGPPIGLVPHMARKIKKKSRGRRLGKNFSIRTQRGYPIDEVNAFEESGEYLFWLIHGLNYLHSNYEEGIWKPLYNIYGGKVPEVEEVQQKIISRFSKNGDLTVTGEMLGTWLSQEPADVYAVQRGILRTIKAEMKEYPDHIEAAAKAPHYGPVWSVFSEIRERSLSILSPQAD